MNIKELNIKRDKVIKDLASKQTDMKSYEEATQRILTDIEEEKELLRLDLIKRIRKHFKGIKPHITINAHSICITVDTKEILYYGVRKFEWDEHITNNLAYTIKSEYDELYGEPKEQVNRPYFDTIDSTFNNIAPPLHDFRDMVIQGVTFTK